VPHGRDLRCELSNSPLSKDDSKPKTTVRFSGREAPQQKVEAAVCIVLANTPALICNAFRAADNSKLSRLKPHRPNTCKHRAHQIVDRPFTTRLLHLSLIILHQSALRRRLDIVANQPRPTQAQIRREHIYRAERPSRGERHTKAHECTRGERLQHSTDGSSRARRQIETNSNSKFKRDTPQEHVITVFAFDPRHRPGFVQAICAVLSRAGPGVCHPPPRPDLFLAVRWLDGSMAWVSSRKNERGISDSELSTSPMPDRSVLVFLSPAACCGR